MKRLSILLLFLSLNLVSGVNLKNGNYFISYTDIVTSSKGKTIDMTRTYNSKSTTVGWFGYGWGTPFETRLEASLDGSVYIIENGTGGKSRFTDSTSGTSTSNIRSISSNILKKLKSQTKLTQTSEKDLLKKLSNDDIFRHKMAKKLGLKAPVKPGRILKSFDYGYQKLAVVPKGYKRAFDSGLVQFFNINGDLIASKNKSGYTLKFSRNKVTGKVEKIFDNLGNSFVITWNSNGFISSVAAKGSTKSTYKYDANENLVASTDINGSSFSYGYDGSHNLTAITDKKINNKKNATIKISYEPKTFFTRKVEKRNGDIVEYKYGSKDKKFLHYWTEVDKKGISGQPYVNKYEYEHKLRADGSQWLYRTKFITGADRKGSKLVGGITRETFNNAIELPKKIVQGSRVTEFKYNKGLMVFKKSNDGEFSKLQYDPKTKRVSRITNNEGWIQYKYNKKGELSKAVDSKGNAIALIYDLKGKISKMVNRVKNTKKQIVSFSYNSQGKPNVIGMDGVGNIKVQYDAYGQVKNVDSSGGREIASQVTGAFQNLLSIVKPAGVNLNL